LEEEKQVLQYFQQNRTVELDKIRKILPADRLKYFKDQIKKIHASDAILKYISQLVHQTRQNPALYLGASPRASIALLSGARALAAMSGRDFITPDDIKEIAYPVLVHRILLTPEKEMEGVTEKDVVKEIIDKTEVPR
jgi:MoxR-like ATPase